MAFLDNSGDIILDAVLTEKGRQRLTSGTGINITKFALGDDEIDYRLYDKNHPSGSAYYDLQILQTPVFEAFTQINANINYGLQTYTRNDILYMPQWKQNTISNNAGFALPHNGIYYIAVNQETKLALEKYPFAGNSQKIIVQGSRAEKAIAYELGLDTDELPKTDAGMQTYLQSMGTLDNRFTIAANRLFISAIMALGPGAPPYAASPTTNTLTSFPTPRNLRLYPSGAPSKNKMNFISYNGVRKSRSLIFTTLDSSTTPAEHSVIAGPCSGLVMFNIGCPPTMATTVGGTTDIIYTDYGKVSQTDTQAFGADASSGMTWDFVDTSVDLVGRKTGASISVPIRIIRRRS